MISEKHSPSEIITWAVERFDDELAMSSSFQMQSLPLLHIVSQVAPQIPIIFLDTHYHFPETLLFRDQLIKDWGLNVRVVSSVQEQTGFEQDFSAELHRTNPDLCCEINKVEPMREAMTGVRGWLSGIRRDQSPQRANIQIVEEASGNITRVHPMATWTKRDIWRYIDQHNLPEHPLFRRGYLSIGCAPCTRPITEGQDERAGRWQGKGKTECGLHTTLRTG